MSVLKINPRNLILLLIIIIVAGLRLASFYGSGPFTMFFSYWRNGAFWRSIFQRKYKTICISIAGPVDQRFDRFQYFVPRIQSWPVSMPAGTGHISHLP